MPDPEDALAEQIRETFSIPKELFLGIVIGSDAEGEQIVQITRLLTPLEKQQIDFINFQPSEKLH